MDISQFKKVPLLGILRGVEIDILEPLTESIASSGLKVIEITMNTPSAAEAIRKMSKQAGSRLIVGSGTVLTMTDLKLAIDSGARFIVSPVYIPEAVEHCVKNKIPVFPGALTPQEIYTAWKAGATMVKVFPVRFFGPGYLKEIKAPLQDIELLACGGVTPENIRSYFANGASMAAFGASVFKKELLLKKDFKRIEESIKALITELSREDAHGKSFLKSA
ncbi:MAG: 2-dehydro-3-deoxyphosphogluconate aldolase [Candidatus Omnitrophica bacterium CG_4_9_14_0_2_um_filter_42_8]|nr:MAG: 2-dehydro-3-deoxyphosphogluconate aldolase [Candidatus Omnitrophica bacterium CG22_combo_CG10-13_8_21_14_all_43_16]PJC48080.1 MAG: 2-dehydro-3-deoxyphosphogluconate aldolase [Candidatus Omnitrophica bacterium CG_4_9_14_0_2_um_filter_42_8]